MRFCGIDIEMNLSRWARNFFVFVVASNPAFAASPPVGQTPEKPLSNVERARAILREGLESKDYVVRKEAIIAMSMVGRNEILLPRLAEFLRDKNMQVRLAAVRALAEFDSAESKDALHKTMEDERIPEVSFAAAKMLARLKDPDPASFGVLMEVFEGKRRTNSGMLKKEERSFFDEFHSTDSAMTFLVGKGIGYAPVPGAGEGFSAIGALLKDPKVSDRASVLFILGRKENPESQRLLREALGDRDWSVRAVAAQMIAHTVQTDLRDSLLPLFEDKNRKVRFRAAGAYLHLLMVAKQE